MSDDKGLSISAYRGNDEYFFVCYSHRDKEQVYDDLTRLQGLGFNVWFDEGIVPGAMWRAELADKIAECGQVLYYVSAASVASKHCDREINFAIDCHKPVLPILLEDVALSPQLRMGLSGIQSIPKHQLGQEQYIAKLHQYLGQVDTTTSATPASSNQTATQQRTSASFSGRKRALLTIGIAVLLATSTIPWLFPLDTAPRNESDVREQYEQIMAGPAQQRQQRRENLYALVEQYPDFPDAWASIALSYGNLPPTEEQHKLQGQAARKSVTLAPKLGIAQLAMAYATRRKQRVEHIHAALELDPNNVDIITFAALFYGLEGEVDKSMNLYEKALELAPNEARIHRRFARILTTFKGRNQQALAHHDRAMELDGYRGYRPANYVAVNDYAGYLQEFYDRRPTSDIHFGYDLDMAYAAGIVDPSGHSKNRWLAHARAAGASDHDIARDQLGLRSFLPSELVWLSDSKAAAVVETVGQRFPALAATSYDFQMEKSALAYMQGNLEVFQDIRTQERNKLYDQLDEYRTADGYVIASNLDIHFSELAYFHLLVIAWGLNEQKLVDELATALRTHYSILRLTNLSQSFRYQCLAWIDLIEGNYDSAMTQFESAYTSGWSPRKTLSDIRRYDVHGRLDSFVADPHFHDLIARDQRKRARELAFLKENFPHMLDPSLPKPAKRS